MFREPESAIRAIERLESLGSMPLSDFVSTAFRGCPDPDGALTNFERWLRSSSSPETQLRFLAQSVRLARLLMLIFGASRHLSDALIQNPELAGLITDPDALRERPQRDNILSEGRTLLASSSSFTHSLDRLRFLKQRWQLPIVVNDLAGLWQAEEVWRAISEVADALIQLAVETVASQHGWSGSLPLMVIAYGKLGGGEVNYSSDVDLAYVHEDGLSDDDLRRLTRTCEAIGRALGDRMGRGSLYRVDLRLRPYGSSGPILRSMRAVEKYFDAYAEPWERQALLRTRPILGGPELVERWEAMRGSVCFPARLSDRSVEEMVAMRARIEETADQDDLKRGVGGIRDVEFLTQTLQMVHGGSRSALRVRGTLDALRALDEEGLLDPASVRTLADGYRFLRQLEHRCQLVGDLQTHQLPGHEAGRDHLARLMGLAGRADLEEQLSLHRRSVRSLYEAHVGAAEAPPSARRLVAERLGPLAPPALQWFDVQPEAEAYYASLAENEGSLGRVERVLAAAPMLVPRLKSSLAVTELLLSGEIEEDLDWASRVRDLPLDASPEQVATSLRNGWTVLGARWILDPGFPIAESLGKLYDETLSHIAKRLSVEFDIVALGSYACGDLSPASDLDVVLLVRETRLHAEAEAHAQQSLAFLAALKRYDAPVELDLRLRPEGGKGLLVRTYEGFRKYELEDMELWERFALGRTRLVHGSTESSGLLAKASYALPLTPERLDELVAMKRRIETERVLPTHRRRNVKLGHGGLSDIEWLVQLHQMRYPTATHAGSAVRTDERLRLLAHAHLINAVELEELLIAQRYLCHIRNRLCLLGHKGDLLPENPDKLERLARLEGLSDPNAFLAHHEHIVEVVRLLYVEGLQRLGARA
ncbi:MAG: nucleotidyltransferase domain-containing protein [Fimbriimonadaceae bacterium]|nr:nucleotidyltransferase domain-containing protein [Fimbriimonadaceae bacterium]